jgi:hypothetical protein
VEPPVIVRIKPASRRSSKYGHLHDICIKMLISSKAAAPTSGLTIVYRPINRYAGRGRAVSGAQKRGG